MTKEERAARAEERRAARAERWEAERADRFAIANALRDVVRDGTATPSQRIFAISVLDYMENYHIIPSRLQYPDTKDDSDMTRLRARFAAELKKAAESGT